MPNQLAQYYRGGYPMEYMHTNNDQWFALVGFAVFVIIVGVALWIVYKIATKNTAAMQGKDPIDIAKERYANGDITKEQYEEIIKTLGSK